MPAPVAELPKPEAGSAVNALELAEQLIRDLRPTVVEVKKVRTSKPGWCVVMNPYPRGLTPREHHPDLETARDEALRVAQKQQCKIHVLGLVGTWEPVRVAGTNDIFGYQWVAAEYE